MKIPGWGYIIAGLIIGGISGYIYKFVPKNGEPNMAMALFFFIGMIFIIIGVIKFFFVKMNDDLDAKYDKVQQEMSANKHRPEVTRMHQPQSNTQESIHTNRVEAQMNRIYNQSNQQNMQSGNTQHSNNYAKTHPYHHTTNASQTSHHDQATQHTAHNAAQSMSIILCKKCGNKNSAVANYCHQCGHGLR